MTKEPEILALTILCKKSQNTCPSHIVGMTRLTIHSYGDGEIVREGAVGDHGDGAFSTGRGGAANIGSPKVDATARKDELAIPEVALRPSMEDQNYHTGRGGQGNAHLSGPQGKQHPEGLADKLKNKLFKKKAAKEETKP